METSGTRCSNGVKCVWCREAQALEVQTGSGLMESGVGDGQSGLVASAALIEKTLSEEPRWQGEDHRPIYALYR